MRKTGTLNALGRAHVSLIQLIMFKSLKSFFLTLAVSVFPLATANALSLTITGTDRTGTLGDAIASAGTSNNLKADEVAAAFGGTWTDKGHIDPGALSEGLLSITFTTGGWGGSNVAGTWTIDPSFWSLYGSAVIGWHVGNGGGDPDSFMFLIEPGATTGTWSYKDGSGGGGLSNVQLYGSGAPRNVPDGGTTVALLGLAIGGVVVARRFVTKA
jgi:hypothetical protein